MSKKTEQAAKLQKKIELPYELPEVPEGSTLLEAGMYCAMLRDLSPARAKAALEALRKAYPDYNEARVAQAQELAEVLAPRGKGVARLEKYLPAARTLQLMLKEVFQKSHGLDFEFLSEDPAAGVKLLGQMDFLGAAVGSVILYLSDPTGVPATPSLVRTLDRLGLMTRTSSMRKAREALDAFAAPKARMEFAFSYGVVADRWCGKKPSCWECPLLDDCPSGKKIFKEWKVQQERLEKQRVKEEARRIAQEKKDAERAVREAAREAKRLEAEEKKLAREAAKRAAAEQKVAEKKAAAAKKAVEAKKAAEAKQREAKKAAAKKAADEKKAAAAKKKAATKKKPAAKKATTKKKAAPKKAVTKKTAAKKATTKKKAVAKKATKKAVTKKKATAKKATKKKATTKKAAAKKVTKKKAAKKVLRRR